MKRIFDLCLACAIIVLCAVPFALLTIWLVLCKHRPLFYISERMTKGVTPFHLVKYRSMKNVSSTLNTGVTGGNKGSRITRQGGFLRRHRLDEFPQLYNVLKGDMSLVGPRPPLRRYTDMYPDLYADVLSMPAGITGLASIIFSRHEARLLANCRSLEDTEDVYRKRCIPRKAKIDLLYTKKASVGLDLYILYLTAAKFFPLPGHRAKRCRRG